MTIIRVSPSPPSTITISINFPRDTFTERTCLSLRPQTRRYTLWPVLELIEELSSSCSCFARTTTSRAKTSSVPNQTVSNHSTSSKLHQNKWETCSFHSILISAAWPCSFLISSSKSLKSQSRPTSKHWWNCPSSRMFVPYRLLSANQTQFLWEASMAGKTLSKTSISRSSR